ncbi:hypothetical protein V1525DRAFT_397933 [Lipomyces kononenkoae]|uniref:Uncharacterized protein n=1 Tax=Lipomyces kononenkoae TaxID=34357 RepID=A0ACC3T7H7_LIPKO
MFNLDPLRSAHDDVRFPFFGDIWENKFLFWAVIIGAVSVFPAVYIPVLNTSVFKYQGISWEWGLVFGAIVIFVLGVEAWKTIKRRTGWFSEHDANSDTFSNPDRELGLRQRFSSFSRTLTTDLSPRSNYWYKSVRSRGFPRGRLGIAVVRRQQEHCRCRGCTKCHSFPYG